MLIALLLAAAPATPSSGECTLDLFVDQAAEVRAASPTGPGPLYFMRGGAGCPQAGGPCKTDEQAEAPLLVLPARRRGAWACATDGATAAWLWTERLEVAALPTAQWPGSVQRGGLRLDATEAAGVVEVAVTDVVTGERLGAGSGKPRGAALVTKGSCALFLLMPAEGHVVADPRSRCRQAAVAGVFAAVEPPTWERIGDRGQWLPVPLGDKPPVICRSRPPQATDGGARSLGDFGWWDGEHCHLADGSREAALDGFDSEALAGSAVHWAKGSGPTSICAGTSEGKAYVGQVRAGRCAVAHDQRVEALEAFVVLDYAGRIGSGREREQEFESEAVYQREPAGEQ